MKPRNEQSPRVGFGHLAGAERDWKHLGGGRNPMAVIVALRLAQRDSPELRVTNQLMTAIGRGIPEQEFVVQASDETLIAALVQGRS